MGERHPIQQLKMIAYLELARPVNCLIVAASVLVGGLLARAAHWGMVGLASVSALLIAGGGYSVNDYFDQEIDRVNRPLRPIPSGRVGRRGALNCGLVLFALGILLSIPIGLVAALIAGSTSVLLYLYSFSFKRRGLAGNLVVSLSTGLAFLYGAVAGGRPSGGTIPFIFAFLFHLGREILKDVEDVEGDRTAGAKTVPLRWGRGFALNFTSGVFLLLIFLTPIPYLMDIYNLFYLVAVLLGVDLALLLLLLWLRRGVLERRVVMVNQLLKVDMLVGLLALYLGRV